MDLQAQLQTLCYIYNSPSIALNVLRENRIGIIYLIFSPFHFTMHISFRQRFPNFTYSPDYIYKIGNDAFTL